MNRIPPPKIPWQITGNHWLSLPCIHPADASIHMIGVVHRAARGAVEFAGARDFVAGDGQPLMKPQLRVDGILRELGSEGMVWERASGWLPTFSCSVGELTVKGTIFAPYGRDADVAGAVISLSIENRAASSISVTAELEGTLGHRQQRVRTPRTFDDSHCAAVVADHVVVLDGAAMPAHAALAVAGDGECTAALVPGAHPGWSIRRDLEIAPGSSTEVAFYVGAGPERDGAEATVSVMRRRGAADLLSATRDTLRAFEQSTGSDALDRLLNRNLMFAYFYGVGRAIDDAHFYLMRTRVPWNAHGLTVNDWEALAWTVAAVQLADPDLARELILRMCELHGYAPGSGVRYLDGTLFRAGFSLEGAAAYAIAVERYIAQTGDDRIVEEPAIGDALYQSHDDLEARRDKRFPLYATELTAGGEPARHPFTAHGNAVVAQAMDVLKRTLDEKSAEKVEDAEAIRAALRRQFATSEDAKTSSLRSALDLSGGYSDEDDQVGSMYWLPFYEAIRREDSTYRRTVRALSTTNPEHLAARLARLAGPDASATLAWLRRAPLDNGLAAELVDEEGQATGNGGDATLAALLAYTVWYCVHVLGVRP